MARLLLILVLVALIPPAARAETQLTWRDEIELIDNTRADDEDQNNWSGAIYNAQRAIDIINLEIAKHDRKDDSLELARRLDHLAELQNRMYERSDALRSYEQALQTRSKYLGANHLEVAKSMANVANLLPRSDLPPRDLTPAKVGQMDRAADLYKKAADIQKLHLGQNHVVAAETLERLAELQKYRHDYKAAMLSTEEASKIREQAQGANHPAAVLSMAELAELAIYAGDPDKARQLVERATAIFGQLPSSSPGRWPTTQQKLGLTFWDLGQVQDAADLIAQPFKVLQGTLGAGKTGERPSRISWGALQILYSDYLSLPREMVSPRDSYAAVLMMKNLGAQLQVEERLRAERLAEGDSNIRYLLFEKKQYADGLAEEAVKGKDSDPALRASLRRHYHNASAALRRALNGSSAGEVTMPVSPEEVCHRLPSGATLLEYVRYLRYQPGRRPRDSGDSYSAFVMQAGRCADVQRVDLQGPVDRISDRISQLRNALLQNEEAPVVFQALELGKLVLPSELREVLQLDASNLLIIAPAEDLALVPFAILPGHKGFPYLLNTHAISYTSSGSDLAAGHQAVSRKISNDLLLLGDPDYDAEISSSPSASTGRFQRLGSKEFENIADIAAPKGLQLVERTGKDVTKSWVLEHISGHRYVHLDTHGYSIGEVNLNPRQNVLERGLGEFSERVFVWSEPLLFSGIALAGANRKTPYGSGSNGILTAFEVTELDLRGTELVVLSACETGLGTIQGGSEVQGFRAAFHLAGAKNMLTSLWMVPRDQTSSLMQSFYKSLWDENNKIGKAEALRKAQLEIMKNYPPASWAGWMLSGDGR